MPRAIASSTRDNGRMNAARECASSKWSAKSRTTSTAPAVYGFMPSATNVLLLLSPACAASVRTARMLPNFTRFCGRSAAGAAALLLATPAAAADATPSVPLINCAGPASGFFGNVRVPAALLAGASLGQLFGSPDKSRGKWVPKVYTMLIAFTVMAEIFVVFVSTATGTRLVGGGFDPMAADALEFLIREFEGVLRRVPRRVLHRPNQLYQRFRTALMVSIPWLARLARLGDCLRNGGGGFPNGRLLQLHRAQLSLRAARTYLPNPHHLPHLRPQWHVAHGLGLTLCLYYMATGVFMIKCLNEKVNDE